VDDGTHEPHPLFAEMGELVHDGNEMEWKETARYIGLVVRDMLQVVYFTSYWCSMRELQTCILECITMTCPETVSCKMAVFWIRQHVVL
jgi:hypothetical protein